MTIPLPTPPTDHDRRDRDNLDELLESLARQVDAPALPQLQALRQRLGARVLRVLLVGEAKRGKSTLGNAILGRELLPTGVRPVTAITTSVEPGSPECLVITYANGRQEQHRVEDLARFVTESENPLNIREVASVRVVVAESPLAPAVLVDTPGVGSVHTHNTAEATQALESMDLAVFVLTADPPISLTERMLLEQVRARAVATFVVLNKVDRLSPAEAEEATAFAAEVAGGDRVLTCSARIGLSARLDQDQAGLAASGIPVLVDAIVARIRDRAELDLVKSVAAAAGRLSGEALARIRLSRAALIAVIEDRGRDVELFGDEVDHSAELLAQALASISWETQQARRRLDEAATEETHRTTLQLLATLDGLAARTTSEQAERQARQAVVALIEHEVAAWRSDQLTAIERSLSSLVGREQEQLDRVAEELGAAARRLLGTDLRPVIEPLPLPEVGTFAFDFSPAMGWNTAMIQGVRHHLPTRWRRKAIATHLRAEAAMLVDRQFGRARSDIQQRLEAAHRELAAEVTTRVTEQRDALTAALSVATDLKASTLERQRAHLGHLDARMVSLQRLMDEFDGPPAEGPSASAPGA